MAKKEKTEALRFLEELWGNHSGEGGHHLLIWTLPDKRSRWYPIDKLEEAAHDVADLADRDVYTGVGLASGARGDLQRAKADEIVAICGLWGDIDIADVMTHKKSNLPLDQDEAMAILADLGAEPTVLVHSGHGLQAWWLFNEPWVFESNEDRAEAAKLAALWNATLRYRAAKRGRTLDSVPDLPRVLRVPGTTNRKNTPVPVKLLNVSKKRYEPDDLRALTLDDEAQRFLTGRRTYHVDTSKLTLSPEAQPNIDKLEAMKEAEPKFGLTWDRKRKDLGDDSPSAYDMSLASYAVMAGWSDQEIVDLLIAHRRRHGSDLKLRVDYYARTIARARDESAVEQGVEEMVATREKLEELKALGAEDTPEGHHMRRTALEHVSDKVRGEVIRVVKHPGEPFSSWKLSFPAGTVLVPSTEKLQSQTFMRALLLEVGISLPFLKRDPWAQTVSMIVTAAEDEDLGREATAAGRATTWLCAYLENRVLVDGDADLSEAFETGAPFMRNGQAWVFAVEFHKFVRVTQGEGRLQPRDINQMLRAAGSDVRNQHYTPGSKRRTTKEVWLVPEEDDRLQYIVGEGRRQIESRRRQREGSKTE